MNRVTSGHSIHSLSGILHNQLIRKSLTLSTAESCTGGMIASCMTDRAGSSELFWGGIVSYSNEAKAGILNVPRELIESCGAVSLETSQAMCRGVSALSGTDLSVSVTGIAGPGGGSSEKPVGTVFISVYDRNRDEMKTEKYLFEGSRDDIRISTVCSALSLLSMLIGS